MEFPWVLVFDLGISTSNKGRYYTQPGQSEKVREFVNGSGKVRKVRDIFEKVREKSGKKIFVHVNSWHQFKKSHTHRNVCSSIVYGNQLYNSVIFASSIKMI